MEAYCVKCRTKRDMKDPHEEMTEGKGGSKRRMMKGKCPECGTGMNKFLPSK